MKSRFEVLGMNSIQFIVETLFLVPKLLKM